MPHVASSLATWASLPSEPGSRSSSSDRHGPDCHDELMTERTQVLYAIVTGAPPAATIGELVKLAQADGWDVCVVASPNGARFIDTEAVATQTGHPVRSEFKQPGTDDLLPAP